MIYFAQMVTRLVPTLLTTLSTSRQSGPILQRGIDSQNIRGHI